MPEAPEAIVDRIKKLLKHAADERVGHTEHAEHEVNVALKLARRLMEKYNLEEADLKPDEAARRVVSGTAHSGRSMDAILKQMAAVPEVVCGVKALLFKGRTEELKYFGQPRDVAVAVALYHELVATMRAMARFRVGRGWNKRHQDYGAGFVARLLARAREAREESVVEAGTTAIVVLKDQLVSSHVAALYAPKPGRTNFRVGDGEAYRRGSADAETVSLGTGGLPAAPTRERRLL